MIASVGDVEIARGVDGERGRDVELRPNGGSPVAAKSARAVAHHGRHYTVGRHLENGVKARIPNEQTSRPVNDDGSRADEPAGWSRARPDCSSEKRRHRAGAAGPSGLGATKDGADDAG